MKEENIMSTSIQIQEKTKIKLKEPKKYKVIMYNDDFTPMDFVVKILMDIFKKSYEEAVTVMMTIHKGTKAVVGQYPYDIAMTKAKQAVNLARKEGYPFRVETEN